MTVKLWATGHRPNVGLTYESGSKGKAEWKKNLAEASLKIMMVLEMRFGNGVPGLNPQTPEDLQIKLAHKEIMASLKAALASQRREWVGTEWGTIKAKSKNGWTTYSCDDCGKELLKIEQGTGITLFYPIICCGKRRL